jgi:hypothetical protein
LEERQERVIDLYLDNQDLQCNRRNIMSLRDNKCYDKEEGSRRQIYKHQRQQDEISFKAYELFSEGKNPVEIAIEVSLREPEATKLFLEYYKLKLLHILISIYRDKWQTRAIIKLFKELITERDMSVEKVVNAVNIAADKLPYMESLYQ